MRLWIAPLRDRPEDIEPIAASLARRLGVAPLAPSMIARLRARPLAGNVRELRNLLQAHAVLGDLADDALVTAAGKKPPPRDSFGADSVDLARPYLEAKDELIERFTRTYMSAMMEETGGNQAEMARRAGLDRTYLGRLLKQYGLGK